MIHAQRLLADLTRQLKLAEDDLRQRIAEDHALRADLTAEWDAARVADRTAETFESWADAVITQAGVHWLLSGVFLRFIEDNGLVARPWLAGPPQTDRLTLARDRHEAYFRAEPLHTDRDYLLAAFREAGALPGLQTFFDEAHNPVFRLGLSGAQAQRLLQFWQQVDPDTGALVHDFTDAEWNTRFLGDLYQDLSEATRKRYALLQTPEFVEEFILDRTLTPALREFGLHAVRMIDPTCGSGHFLLGGFERLVRAWAQAEPGRNVRDVAQRALDAVAGVDLNPFAVAIARFRLLVAALRVSGCARLAEAPDFRIHVAIGDSLLHGTRFGAKGTGDLFDMAEAHADTGLAHAYASEDLAQVQAILGRQYHAVVGNPPYIVVKDAALNKAYRGKYASCHMKYSLGAPFTERFFELAVTGRDGQSAGFIGLITANSFMKREFGSKLIEEVLPRLDLTHVVDTSGAYIPGHGTPTVILFGRHRAPVAGEVRTVMGIKNEPEIPENPLYGLVWNAIIRQIDQADSFGDFVSVRDISRDIFCKHPWSIGGGGVSELKEFLDETDLPRLSNFISSSGFMAITGEDDAFLFPKHMKNRLQMHSRSFVQGDGIRDWATKSPTIVAFPYIQDGPNFAPAPMIEKSLYLMSMWSCRTTLRSRVMFGKTIEQHGSRWDQYMQFIKGRVSGDNIITFAFVATHNHFVLERSGKIFKQSAPVISTKSSLTDGQITGLTGALNSSAACFWMQQTCHNKGRPGANSAGADERYEMRYEFDSTKLVELPICDPLPEKISACILSINEKFLINQPEIVLSYSQALTRTSLDAAKTEATRLRRQMIAAQEELDWRCYRLYGLLPAGVSSDEVEYAPPIEVALGERAFEIVLARRIAAGREQTTWFERHGSTPVTEIPAHWPAAYRRVVERRIALIESDKSIGLIERPEYKRRWNAPAWHTLEQDALREALLARLEAPALWPATPDQPPQLTTTRRLADAVQQHDPAFMALAALYTGHPDFDPAALVADLVAAESVPALPVQRYTDTGLRKRAQWQATWALQRREDRIQAEVADNADDWRRELATQARERFGSDTTDAARAWIDKALAAEIATQTAERQEAEVGRIPVPPKYQSKDFLKADLWRLRGGLDVPKERWTSYPGCERGADGSLPVAWAGWNHLQQATAVAGYFLDMKDTEGWPPERLQPLLAALDELVPWLQQWHNAIDPDFGERMGDYYAAFVRDEARALGFTLEELRGWQPVVVAKKRGRKTKT
jgi:hypothetical protein